MTQEVSNIIKQLKSLWIEMNSNKKQTQNTPNGLFALTLNPNNFVDAVKLEKDFKSILSHYYHWRYGSKWRNLKHIQIPFQGIIEKQANGINHIHITIYQYNIEELVLFVGYIIRMFKSLYIKASYKIKKVYDIDGWHNYTSPFPTHKDKFVSKHRIETPTFICSELFDSSIPA